MIIKHMFTIDEMLGTPLYGEEVERDVLAEASKLGRVEKVWSHPDLGGMSGVGQGCWERDEGACHYSLRL